MMLKRYISMVCIVCIIMSLVIIPAKAKTDGYEEKISAAEDLYQLGLFKGTGTNTDGTPIFDLDKVPTRGQAIIMLVRLLGKEDEALHSDNPNPFDDVAGIVEPYITYAYANGLTRGKTDTHFGSVDPVSAAQYITFVLRSLGYKTPDDFSVATACQFADQIHLTQGEYSNTTANFTRGDVAVISRKAINHVASWKNAKLVRINGRIYEFDKSCIPSFYEVSGYNNSSELYVDDKIEAPRLTSGDLRTDHDSEILRMLNLAVGEYEIVHTDNPYLDGILVLNTNDKLRGKMNRTIKIEFDVKYTGPTTRTYNARYSYNGRTLKQEDLATGVIDGVTIEQGEFRYCGLRFLTLVRAQDIYNFFGIKQMITIGEYMGESCLIIE